MTALLISLFVVGWVAVALIGTQAYFRGEQTKPIHERNWSSESFDQLANRSQVNLLTLAIAFPPTVAMLSLANPSLASRSIQLRLSYLL